MPQVSPEEDNGRIPTHLLRQVREFLQGGADAGADRLATGSRSAGRLFQRRDAGRGLSRLQRDGRGAGALPRRHGSVAVGRHPRLPRRDRPASSGRKPPAERREIWRWILFDNHKLTSYTATLRFMRIIAKTGETPVTDFLDKRARAAWDMLDRQLADRDFVIGDRPTIADLSLCGYLFYDGEIGIEPADYPALPALADADPRPARLEAPVRIDAGGAAAAARDLRLPTDPGNARWPTPSSTIMSAPRAAGARRTARCIGDHRQPRRAGARRDRRAEPRSTAAAVGDVILGCVDPIGEAGGDVAQERGRSPPASPTPCPACRSTATAPPGSTRSTSPRAAVKSGDHDLVIAGGVESMSRVGIGASGGAWPVDPIGRHPLLLHAAGRLGRPDRHQIRLQPHRRRRAMRSKARSGRRRPGTAAASTAR